MNRPCFALISLCAFFDWFAGAQVVKKPADQQSSSPGTPSATPSVADAAKTAVKKVIEPKPLVIPA